MGYLSGRRAGRAAAQGALSGLPRGAEARGPAGRGLPGPAGAAERDQAPALFPVLPGRPGARSSSAGSGRSQHDVNRAVPVPVAVRAGRSSAARAAEGRARRRARGCAALRDGVAGGVRSRRVTRFNRSPPVCDTRGSRPPPIATAPCSKPSTPPSCSCPEAGCRSSCAR